MQLAFGLIIKEMVEASVVLCSVCDHEFDGDQRPPMLLTCGHTFCLSCIKSFERRIGAIICPNCRGAEYRNISQLKKNIQLVPLVDKEHRPPDMPCPGHPSVEAALYCVDCSVSFCAKCVASHQRHELYSVLDQFITCNTTERVQTAKKKLDGHLDQAKAAETKCKQITQIVESKKEEVKRHVEDAFEPVIKAIKNKKEELTSDYWQLFNPVLNKLKSARASIEDVLTKRQKLADTASELNSKLQRTAGTERLKLVAQLETLEVDGELLDLQTLETEAQGLNFSQVTVDISSTMQTIAGIASSGSVKDIERYDQEAPHPKPRISVPQQALAMTLMETYGLSQRIFDVLSSTDRQDFMPAESSPYEDRPQKIGFNTTISAPHMHAITLRMLEDRLKPGIKVLDIGCGSGYLTVCFGKMITRGTVFGVDHIEELINQACENVLKSHFHVFTGKEVEIRFVACDGRDGLPSEAPFDIIHIGAATPEVPPKLLEQLALGGRMLLPLGPQNGFQQIVMIDKGVDGQLKRTSLINVNYAPLIDRDRQCP